MSTINLRRARYFNVRYFLAALVLLSAVVMPERARGEKKPESNVKLQKGTWNDVQALIQKNPGKVVIVDAWSTSCVPCMKEFPNLVKLHQKHSKGLVCVSFSCDYVGIKAKPPEFYEERVLKFLKSKEATFTNILATQAADEAYEQMGIESIPAVFVYGPDGKLAQKFDSEYKNGGNDEEPFTYKDIGALVEKLLAGASQ